jgi:hypothetical protein
MSINVRASMAFPGCCASAALRGVMRCKKPPQLAASFILIHHPIACAVPSALVLQSQFHFVKSWPRETGMALRPSYREAVLAE